MITRTVPLRPVVFGKYIKSLCTCVGSKLIFVGKRSIFHMSCPNCYPEIHRVLVNMCGDVSPNFYQTHDLPLHCPRSLVARCSSVVDGWVLGASRSRQLVQRQGGYQTSLINDVIYPCRKHRYHSPHPYEPWSHCAELLWRLPQSWDARKTAAWLCNANA